MNVRAAGDDEIEAVVELIVAQQARPERHIPYLGDRREGIVDELAGLDTPWTEYLQVAIDDDGRVVGAAFADVDEELGRAWVHGPWVDGDDATWSRGSGPLIDAVEAALPAGLGDVELSGDTRHVLLAAFAADRGHEASEVNWVYTLDLGRAAGWERDQGLTLVRDAIAPDADAIAPLHDAEFPATYLPVDRMLRDTAAGDRWTLVASDDGGRFRGYASGEIQGDGAGYIDFLAVTTDGRGRGAGRALVMTLVDRLSPHVSTGTVHLTVQDHRAPARALYERLGFEAELGLVGYRRR